MSGYLPFIAAAAAIAALTVAILLQPWWRTRLRRLASGQGGRDERRALNAAIYRDQLAELDSDLASGALAADAHAAASNEIKRRLLEDASAADAPATAATSPRKAKAWLAIALLVPLAGASIYLQLGSPAQVLDPGAQAHEARLSMENAVAQLAAKLEAQPDNPEGWAMLARSYGVLSRWEDAARAFARVGPTLQDNAALLAAAAEVDFHRAGERFDDTARTRIARALALDGNNVHALLLAGSDAMGRQQYAEAAGLWERLLAQLEPESADYQEISKVLAQARSQAGPSLGAGSVAAAAAKPSGGASAAAGAFVSGRVELDPALASKVRADDVVFVFARAAAEGDVPAPRMPLAALKLRAGELPREFRLDDAMAMNPALKLSSFAKVRIEAHVARAGTPKVESGDLIGASAPVKPGTRGIVLRIDTVAP